MMNCPSPGEPNDEFVVPPQLFDIPVATAVSTVLIPLANMLIVNTNLHINYHFPQTVITAPFMNLNINKANNF